MIRLSNMSAPVPECEENVAVLLLFSHLLRGERGRDVS